ncbi:hypothetical protein [Paracoccus versutus]|uniref:Uncharacterized protein n=1 Tax=Paracoccus versutus TaxID=34007 RepID=A0AAQ0HHA5_PARVE|nr:hypothetical protein [Paracoccus versutus]REG45765.1 hypothetical protein ATH84_101933 [Paracoccus versutus]
MTTDQSDMRKDQGETIAILKQIKLWLQILAGLLVLLILQVTVS